MGMRYYQIVAVEAAGAAGIVRPDKPLTPTQQRRRHEKSLKVQKRISDEQKSSAQKVADLRAKL